MRATALWLSVTFALELFACGGELAPSDAGSDDDSPLLSVLDAGDEQTGLEQAGYCLFKTCNGLSLCGVGKTCPVGDGCNSCSCAALADGMGSSTCTTSTACDCP
jgi:hypothetical protein